MKKIFLPLPFLIFSTMIFTQNQGIRWDFGNQISIDFSSGVPVEVNDGAMQTFEGCVSYSDAWGNHLFYSNGGGRDPSQGSFSYPGTIWNRDHEVMYDMSFTEGGGWSAQQSSLVVPNPLDPDSTYYLFTMEEIEFDAGGSVPGQPDGRGLSFFEIDMTLNGGLGQVTLADERVYVPLFEALSGTIHANGCDYWIVTSNAFSGNPSNQNSFGVVSVTDQGVSELEFQAMDTYQFIGSQIKISPDGKYLASGPSLFNFDNSTGIISETFIDLDLGQGAVAWAFSFSPNSRYIYYRAGSFGGGSEIIRFDLEALDIAGSKEVLTFLPDDSGPGQMQIGPDGNIYFVDGVDFLGTISISAIRCPNSENPTVDLQIFSFENNIFLGLPNFTDHLFKSEQAGIVDIGPDSLFICAGTTYTIGAETALGAYSWNTGENTPFIDIDQPGVYILTAEHGCGTVSDTLVALNPETDGAIISGPDNICPGEVAELTVSILPCTEPGVWSTGETDFNITVTDPGTYTYELVNVCGQTSTAEIVIEVLDAPEVEIQTASPPPYCFDSTITLNALSATAVDFSWSNDSLGASIDVTESGLYEVTATNICGSISNSIDIILEDCPEDCKIEIPNAFSPNQDGLNDQFGLAYDCSSIIDYQLEVYSRWGEQVFQTETLFEKWTGMLNGSALPEDVYSWSLVIFLEGDEEPTMLSGEVTLLR